MECQVRAQHILAHITEDQIKAISDEIIFHSIKYKILFGSKATTSLQAKFKAVRNSNKPTTDNDLKTRILTANFIHPVLVSSSFKIGVKKGLHYF